MPKHRRDRSRSLDRFRSSPYASSSKSTRLGSSKASPETAENVKEWEDARCPVCMEHPHNAILIICSSHDKGCRPYMCDTSYRHSNCFDQFRKSFEQTSATVMPDENSDIITTEPVSNTDGTVQEQATLEGIASCDNKVQPQLLCPLCRGDIRTWVVLEPARDFMNAKSRSCAREMCDFSGTYADLRKHARHEHPLVRPSEADPERERNWRRLEQERDLGDLLSTLQSSFGEERGDDASGWLTVIFFIRILRPGSGPRSSTRSGTSRTRTQLLSFRRRSTRVLRENRNEEEDAEEEEEEEEEETASSSRDGENDTSDGDAAVPLRRSERLRQRRTPDSS